jgi:hypothetical protein
MDYMNNTDTTTEPTAYLWVCVDCAHWSANGELPDYDTAERVEAVRNGHPFILDCGDDAEHCDPFSWSACDACGSTLGGHRHRAVEW